MAYIDKIKVGGVDYDIQDTALKNAFKKNIADKNTGTSFVGFVNFAVGSFYNGNYTASIKYRVVSREDIVFNDYTIFTAKNGFKFLLVTGSAGSYEDQTGWVTTYNLKPNTNYNICIRRETEDSSEVITDISEFVTAISYVLGSQIANETNSNNIKKLSEGYITPDWGWQRGIVSSSYFSVNNTYRVATPDYITLSKSTKVFIADGFKLGGYYNDGTALTALGWATNELIIDGNKPFRAMIARTTEDSTEIITDITEFTNAISVKANTSGEVYNSILTNNKDVPLLTKQALRPLNKTENQYLTQPKPLVLFHFSDIHGDQTALERLIEFYETNKSLFDDAICTGDLKAVNTSSSMSFWNNVSGAEDVLIAIGNHDVTESGGSIQEESAQYTAMLAPYISNWGVTYSANQTYYYKDYAESEVRLVVLNCMLTGTEHTAQLTWFNTVLAGAKELNYTVVVATHFPNGINASNGIACNFTDMDVNNYGAQFLNGYYELAVRDFITSGGKFACYFGGHVHKDVIKKGDDHPTQLGIFIDACSIQQSMAYSDIYRESNDKTADLANVFVVDTSSNTVKLIRIGADRNRYLVSRKTISINYDTLTVISEN